jgi:lysophospholipase L1-like esterase
MTRALYLLPALLLMACQPMRGQPAPAGDPAGSAAGGGPFEGEIREYEARDRVSPPPQGGVLFVGSSSIRLWDSLQRDFAGTEVINRGFGGSELEHSIQYADRIILPYRPRQVVVYAGDNDISAGKSPERVLQDYRELVRRIHQRLPEATVSFISIKPSVARWHLVDQIRAANELVRQFSASDPRLQYIDVFTPMLGPDGMPRRDLLQQDGLHLTPTGYEVWREAVRPYLR